VFFFFDKGNCIEGSGQKTGEGGFVLGKGEWGGEGRGSREKGKKNLSAINISAGI
jgi:hypothetical protein